MVDHARARLFRADLKVSGDGRTLSGFAVPYDIETMVNDGEGPYLESFKRGAFRQVVKAAHRVPLRYEHDDSIEAWIGKGTKLEERSQGLWSEWRLDDPAERPLVRTLAYKVGDGQLPALSVSFYAGHTEEHTRDGVLHRIRKHVARIDHVALVPEGAYPMLEPLQVRHASVTRQPSSVERWAEWRKEYLDRVQPGA